MLDYHIQRGILHRLSSVDSLRFAELKPDSIDNKLFTYHLKKVISAKLITKLEDGSYALTPEGRRQSKSVLKRPALSVERAYSILFLAVEHESSWLLFKRGTHPSLGLYGFMQATPTPYDSVLTTATVTCRKETGLEASFAIHGSGYLRLYRGDELESFLHFTLLRSKTVQGELHQNSQHGSYEWRQTPDFLAADMLPNMQIFHKMLQDSTGSFVDKTYYL